MKLIITGANGFVAGSIIAQAPSNWELHGIARKEAGFAVSNYIHHELDHLQELIAGIQPDVVIHTAAMANIDLCETNPELAEKTNVGITRTIAGICSSLDAKLIFCSTDSIFDGIKGNYSEQDIPSPVNVYATTKIAAEKIVLEASQKNIVARIALVMGMPVIGKGNSFMYDVIEKLRQGQTCSFPQEEMRTPIDVVTLGEALLELSASSFSGIINLAGNTCISRLEMGKEIARIAGYSTELVIGAEAKNIPGRARRSPNACLDNTLARKTLKTPMLSLTEGINRTIHFKHKLQ